MRRFAVFVLLSLLLPLSTFAQGTVLTLSNDTPLVVFEVSQPEGTPRNIVELQTDFGDVDIAGMITGILFDPEPSATSASILFHEENFADIRMGGTVYSECEYHPVKTSTRLFYTRPTENITGRPLAGSVVVFAAAFPEGLTRLDELDTGEFTITEVTSNESEFVLHTTPNTNNWAIVSITEQSGRWAWQRGVTADFVGGPLNETRELGLGAEQIQTPPCVVVPLYEDTIFTLNHIAQQEATVVIGVISHDLKTQ